MIGIDLIKISRFKDKSELFAKRFLSSIEYDTWINSKKDPKFLATMWAIKESIYKSDNSFYEFSKINIEKQKKYEFKNYEISTSNDDVYVIAFVMKKEDKYESKN